MEFFAETRKLTNILNHRKLLIKNFGVDRETRIQARLDEFEAANTLTDIPSDPPPRCHPLHGDKKGKFAVDISSNYRLVFEGYDKDDNLSTNKHDIVTIQIIAIEDYH